MHIKIGPHLNFWGPYQIADLLKNVGVSEDACYKLGEKLSKTWVGDVCEKIHSRRKRKVKIKLHNYDTWNMDATLSMIILPMLVQLKKSKHGSPFVQDEDVPEHLRSDKAPPKENEWDTDELFHDRWNWIMDELIWAFEQLQPDTDWESQYTIIPAEIDFEAWEEDPKRPGISELVWKNKGQYDYEGMEKHRQRIQNGLRLFGVYYQGLWD